MTGPRFEPFSPEALRAAIVRDYSPYWLKYIMKTRKFSPDQLRVIYSYARRKRSPRKYIESLNQPDLFL